MYSENSMSYSGIAKPVLLDSMHKNLSYVIGHRGFVENQHLFIIIVQ